MMKITNLTIAGVPNRRLDLLEPLQGIAAHHIIIESLSTAPKALLILLGQMNRGGLIP